MQQLTTHSVEETLRFGKQLGQQLLADQHRPVVVALIGEMGVGKTHFTKGIAQGLGITERVKSPTYALVEEYPPHLIHIDAWRLENAEELWNVGLEKYLQQKTIIVIEWPNKNLLATLQGVRVMQVEIKYGSAENERTIWWS